MFPISIDFASPVVDSVVLAIHILLALTVTVDVLLKKSDVRAALGWTAAAWLSPFLGALLYYMFGINRVTRRALKLGRLEERQATPPRPAEPDAPPNIALLSEVSARITGDDLTGGNSFAILQGGDQAYPQMLQAIGQAKNCIALTSYIFRDDAAGREFSDALIAAHKRGVKVRVLLDSVGSGYLFAGGFNRLMAGGVLAARFLHTWLPWRMPFLNMRNHRKLMVVDGRLSFTGGMNIGAENSQRLTPHGYIEDIHFRVEGPAVRVVMDAFARDWTFTTGETLDDDCWWPHLEEAGPVFARGLRSGPDADLYKLEFILGAALTLAKKRIRIVTPYFLPDPRLQFAIAQAGLRGVVVEIVLPGRNNHAYMDWATRAHLRFFRHIRASIFLTPMPFDHSKLCTVDGEWCLIGSSNWDARSFRLNFEFDLECTDRELTSRLDTIIDTKIAQSAQLTSDMLAAEPVWKRLRNAATRLMMPYL